MSYFSYNQGTDQLPADVFRISPSQLSRFFDSTAQWYRENLLGEAPAFEGSTSSELGTCTHAAAAMYFDTGKVDTAAIDEYISSITTPDVDHTTISDQYRPMVNALITQFLSANKGTHSEWFVSSKITDTVYVAGSIDMYDQRRQCIIDYKTMGSLDTARVPTSFPRAYYFQQLTYAYILRQNGLPVDYCKLVYVSRDNTGRISEKTGKPLTDYPSTVNVLVHNITDEDMQLISDVLKLIAASVTHWQQHPEHRYLLAQDYRLRLPDKPRLFKD